MEQYISKSALVAEIEKRMKKYTTIDVGNSSELEALYDAKCKALMEILSFLDTLKVKDPYEEVIQYDSVKRGIQAHAETYSFNIESKLFNQLTKEQQELWREEIEQAVISGGEAGVELARNPRYKENFEVKKMDLEKEITQFLDTYFPDAGIGHKLSLRRTAKHFFKLGLNSQTKDMQDALRIEYEKGRADVLRCIDPDEMVADFCSQPLSKTRSIASVYRQGIIDVLKRINKNEETSITNTRSIDDGGVQLPKH